MTAHTADVSSIGFSLQKLFFRILMVGALALTLLYAKTISVFLKVFVKELFAGAKSAAATPKTAE